jgi:hypothetical protein
VVVAEIAPRFSQIEALRQALPSMVIIEAIPLPASFPAAHAHAEYRRSPAERAKRSCLTSSLAPTQPSLDGRF